MDGRRLVLSIAKNHAAFVAGYVGMLRGKHVQLIVNDAIAPEFLARLILMYSPEFIYLPDSLTSPVPGKATYENDGYRLIKNESAPPCALHNDLALLLSTSGSTGSPKLVRISYENVRANTNSIIDYLSIVADDKTVTTMPLSYSYGLSILNTHLSAGASIVLTDASIMNREFWNLVQERNVTSFGGVPYFYEMLKKLKFERIDLPSLRYVTQAGGKLSPSLAREFTAIFQNKNIRFYLMYGQTEATARISYLCATDHPDRVEGIGKAIPGGELWIQSTNDGGRIENPGTPGELVYRGPNVSMGFAECRSDLALGDANGGVLLTGDLATCDHDGYFSIVGRKNRFLKVFGLRVNLIELEAILRSKGIECACGGTDQMLSVYYAGPEENAEIGAKIIEAAGIHRNGIRFVRVHEIPRTESGKVNYQALASGPR